LSSIYWDFIFLIDWRINNFLYYNNWRRNRSLAGWHVLWIFVFLFWNFMIHKISLFINIIFRLELFFVSCIFRLSLRVYSLFSWFNDLILNINLFIVHRRLILLIKGCLFYLKIHQLDFTFFLFLFQFSFFKSRWCWLFRIFYLWITSFLYGLSFFVFNFLASSPLTLYFIFRFIFN